MDGILVYSNSMNDLEGQVAFLQSIIDKNRHIVFFGGAGVSTESGIPDFRSQDGIYNQEYDYPPEEILSHSFFYYRCEEFYRFYREKMLVLDKEPNDCHMFLTELEKSGKLDAVITQNIDGLHQKAGTKKVIELHGSIHRNRCIECGEEYTAQYIKDSDTNVPRCALCGGIIKPDVVLYGEPLDEQVITQTMIKISNADVLIVAGTSLMVYPANTFLDGYRGNKLILINKDITSNDRRVDYVIHAKVGELFRGLKL